MAKPPIDDSKEGKKHPGKAPPTAFDPRAEDWRGKGKRGFAQGKPTTRPFKGGARGR